MPFSNTFVAAVRTSLRFGLSYCDCNFLSGNRQTVSRLPAYLPAYCTGYSGEKRSKKLKELRTS